MPRATPPAAAADPFLFDAERLQALSSEPVVRRGVAYFKENLQARRGGAPPPAQARAAQVRARRRAGPAASIVHLDWSGADSPRIRRRRAAFTLANYELVLRDGERIQAELSPDLLVLDEAQRGIS